jgi:hypothetical protein
MADGTLPEQYREEGHTVRSLRELLEAMPQDVSVFFSDSQNGDRRVRQAEDTATQVDGARIVRLSEGA